MKLKTGTAALILICLVVFAVGFGAYRGWNKEKSLVNETYPKLEAMLQTRVESANNVLTVASRHLPGSDDLLLQVSRDRDILAGKASLREKAAANEALTRDASALLEQLSSLTSVQADGRDLMYVSSYLPQMLAESESLTAKANYNTAAREFNESLKGSFSGWLARLMNIGPAEEFTAQ
ncbi:MAG: LemA family protein [Clostridiales bacterium]|nr:LemA family protein [Clostridiales bacterium]